MILTSKFLIPAGFIVCFALSVLAQQDTSIVYAPLADSIQVRILQQQRMEHLNSVIDSLSTEMGCEKIQNLTVEERKYCHSRFILIHPEVE